MIVPTTLKRTCVAAARFAATDAPIEARIAVIVVPILSPKRIGKDAVEIYKIFSIESLQNTYCCTGTLYNQCKDRSGNDTKYWIVDSSQA